VAHVEKGSAIYAFRSLSVRLMNIHDGSHKHGKYLTTTVFCDPVPGEHRHTAGVLENQGAGPKGRSL
jgi:hypothetical protein